MSDSELNRKEAEKVVESVLQESARVLGHDVAPGKQGASDIRDALEGLAHTTYATERDNFIELEASESGEIAQASGRGRFTPFFLASLRRYLCGDKEAAAQIQKAVKEAKAHSHSIGLPTSASLSAGGAAIVYVAVSGVLAGTALAALAPPLVAGAALIIFLSGFDFFANGRSRKMTNPYLPRKPRIRTSSPKKKKPKQA